MDVPYGFEKPVAKTLHDIARAAGTAGGGNGVLPEQRRVAIARAPSGGIPARSGTTPGTATCVFWQIAAGPTLSSTSISETVYNISGTAVANSAYITVKREYISGKWIVDMESCEPA